MFGEVFSLSILHLCSSFNLKGPFGPKSEIQTFPLTCSVIHPYRSLWYLSVQICFIVSCRVLEILALEMSSFSQM